MAPPGQGPVFGQAMKKRKGGSGSSKTNYQRQFGGGGSSTSYRQAPKTSEDMAETKAEWRRRKQAAGEVVDESFGVEKFAFHNVKSTDPADLRRRGWLYNVLPTVVSVASADGGGAERSGLDLYFCTESRNIFKSTVLFRPYFYLMPDLSLIQDDSQTEVVLELLQSNLNRQLEGTLSSCRVVHKLDLDQPNHLSPNNHKGRPLLQLFFDNVTQLMEAREQLRSVIQSAQTKRSQFTFSMDPSQYLQDVWKEPLQLLTDMREYDVPYVVRVCTDLDIRCGTWYTVQVEDVLLAETDVDEQSSGGVTLLEPDRESKAEPTFLAFDIECTKAPLKFPSADVDEIFMISYMVSTPTGGQGYLITSRSVVSQDVGDFEYTPKPNYPGPFHIFNEVDEKALLERFFHEYRKHRPHIVVTYNGDFFDWPFVNTRAKHHGINLFEQTGVEEINGQYCGRASVHLDAFHWVQRDSYLPQGAQGLKAVTKYKLGYDPVEVDPEDMVRMAQERPVHMATYSVSDAVSTFYLHEKYVHLFIFSLCTIIPMGPEDVLRKGSGTLCEALLMVQACQKGIICPNKQTDTLASFHQGHLLESETYIGGKVECLEAGVYRSDLEYQFDLKPAAFEQLIGNVDRDLMFAIEVEGDKRREDIMNYDEIREKIIRELEGLRDRPKRKERPYVYHLDVGAMYPNIILTNRLQPSAIVDDATCAACDFNQTKNNCKRKMDWIWRGDYNPASKNDYDRTRDQLSREVIDGVLFSQMPENDQAALVSKRLKDYSRNVYKKTKITEEITREDVVCMRENDFYVGTVRQFRDRRYEYKSANKAWKKKVAAAKDAATKKFCEDKVLVYDSLQVAHKCILNSFYGYVMRKGARWRSMEMAGIVTKTGSDIITQARILVEQIGRPIELDTDGIWCILPISFPDVYTFELSDGSKMKLEYPCVMLNAAVHDTFTNHQYQTLEDPERGIYSTQSECSIFFEVDGPYRCMFLPASTEEGKLLKKRYAVFNFDKSLAELKGFELKRRGELELIKTFQSQVFERFLDGDTLQGCYAAAADVANHWIDVIDTRGESLEDDELVELVCENKNMSRQLDDYGANQKGTALTTARRLGEFLGMDVIKDKGLSCRFIIAEQPYGAPVTDRAIPIAIWSAGEAVTRHYLRKWLKAPGLDGDALDMRNILDWEYYRERLSNTIRKIITIPAALQKIPNPVPRVAHPDWLESKVNTMNDRFKQKTLGSIFEKAANDTKEKGVADIEDFASGSAGANTKRPIVHSRRRTLAVNSESTPVAEERQQLAKDNFPDWLRQKKASWRKARSQRRTDSLTGSHGPDKRQKTAVTIEGFVQDAAKSMLSKEWHVVEIREVAGFDTTGQSTTMSTLGDFTAFVMVADQLQRIRISVPRTFYISSRFELQSSPESLLDLKKVEKHLPHNKASPFVYEVTLPEYVFQKQEWIRCIQPANPNHVGKSGNIFETMFESGVPLLQAVVNHIGCVSKLSRSADGGKGTKTYSLAELARIDRPSEGEYLSKLSAYKRLFLYVRIHPRSKTGLVCLFSIDGPDGEVDVSRPSASGAHSFDVGATCHVWIVKPGAQKNVSSKQCQKAIQELMGTIEGASDDTEYACVSSTSSIQVRSLQFVDTEHLALAGANETISAASKTNSGPTIVMITSSKPTALLRRYVSSLSSLPIIPLPFPPGPLHNPDLTTLPPLNWELPSIQLGLEAYLFSVVIAFPKRVSYARYGQIPLGNLGVDENVQVFDCSLSRLLRKNRTLSWASAISGRPDLGVNFLPSPGGGIFPLVNVDANMFSQDEIWGDDDLLSPIVRRPGCYRSVCIDIDLQDLAIAALTDTVASMPALNIDSAGQGGGVSPTSVAQFDFAVNSAKSALCSPLGDEQATLVSLSLVRALICGWLKDAFTLNSLVADELLHHIYRLFSNPDSLLHDPALHRVLHGLMKSTFLRLLGELQRLGCSIVFASFTKITIATNKIYLSEAEEYVDFVVSTVRKRASDNPGLGDALARISLRPTLFYSQLVFLDEFNHSSMILRRITKDELDDPKAVVVPDENADDDMVVVAMTGLDWSLLNYLGSDIAQEYFKIVIGRFSKSVLERQISLEGDCGSSTFTLQQTRAEQLLKYRKIMISKHFASLCTRAVDDILKDEEENRIQPPLSAAYGGPIVPALEFIKNVVAVLELDTDLDAEVQSLKRSLLAQVGIAEYAKAAQWKNPCPSYILPDVFCLECNETSDLNLCHVPPRDADDDEYRKDWICDCDAPYDVTVIEKRLVGLVHRKVARYQLQDMRCVKTNRVATRALAPFSDCSAGLKLDITEDEMQSELHLLCSLSVLHELETLKFTTEGLLASFSA